jgi:hypothetical protein
MPGGVSQARQLIRALTEVLEWDPDSTETEDMGHLLTLFMETCEALQSCTSPFEIKKRLQAVPMLEEAPLYGFLAVCQEFYKDSAASWKDEETRQNVSEAQQELEDEDGWIRYNSEKANAHFRSDETGLNVHMPIYTIGTQGEQNYLNTLETADGRKLNWERINSYVVDPNYVIAGDSFDFTITKRPLTLSGVWTYAGNGKSGTYGTSTSLVYNSKDFTLTTGIQSGLVEHLGAAADVKLVYTGNVARNYSATGYTARVTDLSGTHAAN